MDPSAEPIAQYTTDETAHTNQEYSDHKPPVAPQKNKNPYFRLEVGVINSRLRMV